MLLTSSQVSVLITSGIVLLCTSALFISGCLIQQRTLRDLRSAIRPAVVTRPKPKVWDTQGRQLRRGKTTTIRLEDGTRVEIQGSDVELAVDEPSPPESEVLPPLEEEGEVVEVRLTPEDAEELGQEREALSPPLDDERGDDEERGEGAEGNVEQAAAPWDGVQEGGKPLSRAERRRRIKAEIQRLSQGDTPVYYQRRLW
ncbi:hypothetical protein F4825DRAFT_448852 [Nemania diffusa]|nr:hypothetical protein F4825DRAFT_448852 [Nemania diffusa]